MCCFYLGLISFFAAKKLLLSLVLLMGLIKTQWNFVCRVLHSTGVQVEDFDHLHRHPNVGVCCCH
jgi:hypothetical protein